VDFPASSDLVVRARGAQSATPNARSSTLRRPRASTHQQSAEFKKKYDAHRRVHGRSTPEEMAAVIRAEKEALDGLW
jgi:hypothetical protein